MKRNQRIKTLFLIFGIFWAAHSLASDNCLQEIRKADRALSMDGGDQVSAQTAMAAVRKCQGYFNTSENTYYSALNNRCKQSFSGLEGTTTEALKAVCRMNAIRYVMSLQIVE